MIGLVVRFVPRAGHAETFDALVAETLREVEREPGTVCYLVHENRDEPNERVFFELYQDEAAFDAHETAPFVQRFLGARGEHLSGDPEVIRIRPVMGFGIDIGEASG